MCRRPVYRPSFIWDHSVNHTETQNRSRSLIIGYLGYFLFRISSFLHVEVHICRWLRGRVQIAYYLQPSIVALGETAAASTEPRGKALDSETHEQFGEERKS